jgi:hypothetical protein
MKYWQEKAKESLKEKPEKYNELLKIAKVIIKTNEIKSELKEAPMFYILSLFCIEHRFKESALGFVKFGDRIFGKDGESKFLKDFMSSVSLKGIIKGTKRI